MKLYAELNWYQIKRLEEAVKFGKRDRGYSQDYSQTLSNALDVYCGHMDIPKRLLKNKRGKG